MVSVTGSTISHHETPSSTYVHKDIIPKRHREINLPLMSQCWLRFTSYDLIINSQVVHNFGHDFSKRLTLQGCTIFNHQYCPATCLSLSPQPRRMAEWAQLQPLACMNLPQGPLVCGSPTSVPTTLPDHRHLLHTPSSFNFFHRRAHANGKLQTKGSLATPSQVSSR